MMPVWEGAVAHDFASSLQRGKLGEAIARTHLELKHHAVVQVVEDMGRQRLGLDLIVQLPPGGLTLQLEVKTDYRAQKTGNVFFETRSTNVSTGWVYSSQSDFILYFLDGIGEVLWFPVSRIKREIGTLMEQYPIKVVQNKGYTSQGVVIPLAAARELARHTEEVVLGIKRP